MGSSLKLPLVITRIGGTVRAPEQGQFDLKANDEAACRATSRQYYQDWERPIQKLISLRTGLFLFGKKNNGLLPTGQQMFFHI